MKQTPINTWQDALLYMTIYIVVSIPFIFVTRYLQRKLLGQRDHYTI